MDNYKLSYYLDHTNRIIDLRKGNINNDEEGDAKNKERHKKIISKFQENYSIRTYALDKEITCDGKQDIYGCLIDLF